MHTRTTIRFKLRTDRPKDGKLPIIAQMFIGGEKCVVPLDMAVRPEQWDRQRQCVKPRDMSPEQAQDMNIIIEQFRQKYNTIIYEYRIRNRTITKDEFRKAILQQHLGYDFHAWAEARMQALRGERAPLTLAQYRVTFRALREFMPVLQFADLTPAFPQKLESWLIRRGLGVNARGKYHKHVKAFCRELAHEHPMPEVYSRFKVSQVPGNRPFLLKDEVQCLTSLYDSHQLGEELQHALAMFLFSCHTGLRFADLIHIDHSSINGDYLTFMPGKTRRLEKRIDVPLSAEARRFIVNPQGNLFDPVSNQHYGRQLKEVMRVAGIRKQISAHSGRHTFGTGYIANGGKVEVLQRIMGHADLATTMVYVRMSRIHIEQERHVMESLHREKPRPETPDGA